MELQPGIPQGKSSQSSEYFLIKNSFLRDLSASAVQFPSPCTEIASARLATRGYFLSTFLSSGFAAAPLAGSVFLASGALASFAAAFPMSVFPLVVT